MTIFSSIIMFNSKKFKSSTFKITLGLFFSVIIYYVNNFFNVLGTTEKISIIISVWAPLILLMSVNIYMFIGINEK